MLFIQKKNKRKKNQTGFKIKRNESSIKNHRGKKLKYQAIDEAFLKYMFLT